jgi:hypothetical protein
MARLSLQLLGPFQASLDGQPLTDFRTRKVQALLLYLAVETQAHNRDLLLDLLWPGLPERSARSNLRQTIYYLRQIFPDPANNGQPVIIVNRQEIQLNPQAAVTIDVAQFQALLDQAQAHNHLDLFLCADCRRDLEQAVALYRGDFLADFYLDDSNEFEEWAQRPARILPPQGPGRPGHPDHHGPAPAGLCPGAGLGPAAVDIDNLRESRLPAVDGSPGPKRPAPGSAGRLRKAAVARWPKNWAWPRPDRTTDYYHKIRPATCASTPSPVPRACAAYELREQIGEGGYGVIHRALQPAVGREVAVKVIRQKYANDPDFIRRFEAEAQLVARLEHPYIVPLYDYWRDPERAYLVMRYMRQGSLLTALKAGPWQPERAVTCWNRSPARWPVAHQRGRGPPRHQAGQHLAG